MAASYHILDGVALRRCTALHGAAFIPGATTPSPQEADFTTVGFWHGKRGTLQGSTLSLPDKVPAPGSRRFGDTSQPWPGVMGTQSTGCCTCQWFGPFGLCESCHAGLPSASVADNASSLEIALVLRTHSPLHLPHRRLVSGACIAASRVKPAAVCLSSRTIWPRLLGRRQPPSRPSRPPSPLPPGMLPGDRSPTTIRRLGPPPPLTRSRSPAPKRQKG